MSAAVACSPSITAAGSPGASRVMKKTRVATSSITTAIPAKRDARYRVISLLQPRVPEEGPRHRDVAVELGRARRHAVEVADTDVRHLVVDDRLDVAPQRPALLRIRLGVERGERRLLGRRAPPTGRAVAELRRGERR